MREVVQKSLLLPINDKRELFIQDRRGYKKPDWGFFGGGIEAGETPLKALIREAKEELDINLIESTVTLLGESATVIDDLPYNRFLYLYRTNQETFTVLEGQGGYWVTFAKAKELLQDFDKFDEIEALITKHL